MIWTYFRPVKRSMSCCEDDDMSVSFEFRDDFVKFYWLVKLWAS